MQTTIATDRLSRRWEEHHCLVQADPDPQHGQLQISDATLKQLGRNERLAPGETYQTPTGFDIP